MATGTLKRLAHFLSSSLNHHNVSHRMGLSRVASSVAPWKLRPLHPKEAAAIGTSQTDHDLRFKSEDYKLFHRMDPSGYFVATSESGEIVGIMGAPILTENDGFVGFHHVHEDYRDRDIEERLWSKAKDHLGGRRVGLEVSPSEVQECRQLGFKEAWRNGLFKGTGAQLIPQIPELQNSPIMKHVRDIPFSSVIRFDETIVGYERVNFLYKWTQLKEPCAAIATYSDEEVVGYGVLRELHHPGTYRVGPLYANHMAMAQVILVALINHIPEKTYYVQSPLTNPAFIKVLTDQLGMERIEETVRMYTGGDPEIPTHKVFGIVSADIG